MSAEPRLSAATVVAHTCLTDGYWQVRVINADGAMPRVLTTTPWDKRCLRPGIAASSIILRNNEGQLFALDCTVPDRLSRLLPEVEPIKDFDFRLGAGFLIAAYAPNALDSIFLWHVAERSEAKRLLISDPHLNEMPRWLPDGDGFVFVKSHAGKSALHLARVLGAKVEPLLKETDAIVGDPCPSPDGKVLAISRQGCSSMDLWLLATDGSKAREIHAGPGLDAEPCWSPDGEWILFASWDGTNFRIARTRKFGGDFSYITEPGTDCRSPLCVNIQ